MGNGLYVCGELIRFRGFLGVPSDGTSLKLATDAGYVGEI